MAPEASDAADRDQPPAPYTAAGQILASLYLKWLLVFEDHEAQVLWLGKAVPRDWLVAGEAPLSAQRLSTRYGRIGLRLEVLSGGAAGAAMGANVTLPGGFCPPAGGIRLRIRTPPVLVGRLSTVTVGGRVWTAVDAAAETVHFSARDLADGKVREAMQRIVATYSVS